MSENSEEKRPGLPMWRRLWHIIGGSVFPISGLLVTRGWILAFLGAAVFHHRCLGNRQVRFAPLQPVDVFAP